MDVIEIFCAVVADGGAQAHVRRCAHLLGIVDGCHRHVASHLLGLEVHHTILDLDIDVSRHMLVVGVAAVLAHTSLGAFVV